MFVQKETMSKVIHRAETRGFANHGWLQSYHSFSFAGYTNPERIHFGALRVLNDDTVAAGMGFSTHAHSNMEIISIPLAGDLEHRDSMGTVSVIQQGDIQVMSAGSGIQHSEYNKNKDKPVKFLQIWIIPNKHNVTPRYGQLTLDKNAPRNTLQQIISPNPEGEGLWIHQEAWFYLATLEEGKALNYSIREGNGLYIFVLDGKVRVDDDHLSSRDGLGLWNQSACSLEGESTATILFMEVPMTI